MVQQARADLELAEAALETQRRVLPTQRSAVAVASEQTQRAVTKLDLATRTSGSARWQEGDVPRCGISRLHPCTGDMKKAHHIATSKADVASKEHALEVDLVHTLNLVSAGECQIAVSRRDVQP